MKECGSFLLSDYICAFKTKKYMKIMYKNMKHNKIKTNIFIIIQHSSKIRFK
jgi:hypothetical protein